MVNLEYYRVFYHAARLRSITRAAESLNITQPAVSQAIRHLEDMLGGTLFIRNSRGVRLTSEGEVLFESVSRGYTLLEQAESRYRSLLDLETGDVRIGASDMTLRYFLLDRLEAFSKAFPAIRIHITDATTPETLTALKNGVIDFGVVTSPPDTSEGVRSFPVACFEDIFVAGSRFSDLSHSPMTIAALNQQPLICLDTGTRSRQILDQHWRQHGQVLNPAFELASSSLVLAFAEKNLGIGCLAAPYARDAIAAGRLVELIPETPMPPRQIVLVTHDRIPLSPAGRHLLALLKT